MKSAFSTLACPAWTLDRVAESARAWGYHGVELRTFGFGPSDLACDPCHTCGEKTARLFAASGVAPLCLATGLRFDARIWPPLIGRAVGDHEAPIRQVRRIAQVASEIGAPFVRVFGFELPAGHTRSGGIRLIAERLHLAAQGCRNTGVRLLIENGGSFRTSAELLELLDETDAGNLLAVSLAPDVSRSAGEDPIAAMGALAGRVEMVRLRVQPGASGACGCGIGCEADSLAEAGYEGWTVIEADALWAMQDRDPGSLIAGGAKRLSKASRRGSGCCSGGKASCCSAEAAPESACGSGGSHASSPCCGSAH